WRSQRRLRPHIPVIAGLVPRDPANDLLRPCQLLPSRAAWRPVSAQGAGGCMDPGDKHRDDNVRGGGWRSQRRWRPAPCHRGSLSPRSRQRRAPTPLSFCQPVRLGGRSRRREPVAIWIPVTSTGMTLLAGRWAARIKRLPTYETRGGHGSKALLGGPLIGWI